jgi:NADPH:quinone reductase-like Zn-dependent oxidoreductase
MSHIPHEMRVLQLNGYHDDVSEAIRSLQVVKKPIRAPGHGKVLIKVDAAPCNPSDLLLLQGRYGKRKTLPAVPGWEGAGTVIATGGGLYGKWLEGKRVAFSVQSDADGTWAEYSVVDAKTCIPLKSDVSFEQGASLIINPLTALGLIDKALKEKHKAIIQTAAASQVGKMVLALAHEKEIPVIHIVRKKEQEDVLRNLDAKVILNSESPDFKKNLKREAEKFKATIAFEAIAGDMTGTILNAMPNHSKVLVYGALSGTNCSNINPIGLIFEEKTLEGFFLGSWIAQKGFWGMYQASNTVQRLLSTGAFHTSISKEVKLEEAPAALEAYQKNMTAGKVLIKPQL